MLFLDVALTCHGKRPFDGRSCGHDGLVGDFVFASFELCTSRRTVFAYLHNSFLGRTPYHATATAVPLKSRGPLKMLPAPPPSPRMRVSRLADVSCRMVSLHLDA